jgi:hypothetical protein
MASRKEPRKSFLSGALKGAGVSVAFAAATAQAMPASPPPGLITPSPRVEDTMTPEVCVKNTDLAEVSQNAPELSRALFIMGQLPLTGRGPYDMLRDPANHMTSCLYPTPPGGATESSFEGTRAHIGRGTGTATAFHEYFHAWQTIQEGDDDMYELTLKDALAANLLKEAAAVAYEMAAKREAQNLKFAFEPASKLVRHDARGTVTTSTLYASQDPDNLKAFNAAYDTSWKQGAASPTPDREAAALQAGGQAVVRRLMSGADKNWKAAYGALAAGNINRNLDAFREDGTSAGYADKRRRVFLAEGGVSGSISFLPPEFAGPGAAAAVEASLARVNLSTEPAPAGPHGIKAKFSKTP